MRRIGGDDTTVLECVAIRPTETGTTYYTFNQQAGDIMVHGASVKLIADKDNKAIGLVSSVLPNVKTQSLDSWGTSQQQAEDVVRAEVEGEGATGIDVVPDASEQTLIALEDGSEVQRYAWVVYTQNYYEGVDMGYLAHYVSEDGEYLYNIPVAEPNNTDALIGEKAAFDFDSLQQDEWSGDAVLHDGSTKTLTLPVLVDPATGDIYLADAKRKVLCADYPSYTSDGEITPITAGPEGEFNSIDVLVYDTYLRIWDSYDSIGWTGPDSMGTPSLLLMNLVDSYGDPSNNAVYIGRSHGWQTFAFSRIASYGECTDVMGHEFTHCVTGTTMTTNLYKNDMGAINEGMSDIMGNLVEMQLGDSPDGAWIHGEGGGETTLGRSMKDPHQFSQPDFAWDTFYAPAVAVGNDYNDQGGVHTNSSLLNIVSYKLDQAGMQPEDQFYFWMNVALAMTPNTDYPQMAQLLPWCLQQTGYGQYADSLEAAIEDAKYTVTEPPEETPANLGTIALECPDQQLSDDGNFVIFLYSTAQGSDIRTWPQVGSTQVEAALPAGDYKIMAWVSYDEGTVMRTYTEDGWDQAGSIDDMAGPENGALIHVEAGQTITLPSEGVLG